MFQSIVSALSISPQAVSQLTFYARRLRQESITRLFSALAAVLLIGLQVLTIAAPPGSASASSGSANDLVFGGIVSKDDYLSHYNAQNDEGVMLRGLLGRFGITADEVNATTVTTINSAKTDGGSLMSIGHQSFGFDDQIQVTVPGITNHDFFLRKLHDFDTGSNVTNGSNYQALAGTASNGQPFYIMFACGNLVVTYAPPALVVPTPTPTPTPAPTPTPTPTPVKSIACTSLTGTPVSGTVPLSVNFTGVGTAVNQTITKYSFDFGDSATEVGTAATASHTYKTPGTYTATLLVTGSAGTTTAVSKACSFTITVAPTPAVTTLHKSAVNLTQNADATTKTAAPGDKIRYTLTAANSGGTAEPFIIRDDITDILEYADVVDPAGGTVGPGLDTGTTAISWPQATIEPGSTLTETFTIQVKPAGDAAFTKATGTSNQFSFDSRMDNVYNDSIRIPVEAPAPKQLEMTSNNLPQTGAGTSLTLILVIGGLIIFFYLRNRQLITEIKILRNEYQGDVSHVG